jgi:hypothetical protein
VNTYLILSTIVGEDLQRARRWKLIEERESVRKRWQFNDIDANVKWRLGRSGYNDDTSRLALSLSCGQSCVTGAHQ